MMKRSFILAGLFFLWPQIVLFAQFSGKPFHADIVYKGTDAEGAQTKIFWKNGKTRMESNMSGRQSVLIKGDQAAYMYFPENNTAIPMSIEQANKSVPSSSSGSCTALRQEMVEGRMCDVMECEAFGNRSTVWMDKEIGYPIKSEFQGGSMYLKNIVVSDNMDDSLFELPAGAQVTDMARMIQQQSQGQQ